ncbi:hypothetical protein V5O48_016040 [Marasmius crinis-equi]|uniref:Uncharacterized protein n=1 Tax=Marasmius crinis-equi TaxID=585013 RepID=A0ABR3EST3_9AGAR
MQKPSGDYTVRGCDHGDVQFRDLRDFRNDTDATYLRNLETLCSALNPTQYSSRRLETGIVKPTIFLGLRYTLGCPAMFPLDIMHLADLNDTDLFVSLWQGKIKWYGDDNPSGWEWVVLTSKMWDLHGESITLCTAYLPVSFGRAPRNPAQKINSGYKAWEYCIWFYGLGPTLLRNILPEKYWRNYCQLVRGLRLAKQYSLTHDEVNKANRMLSFFVKDFERLYVQRNPNRIHFVRQSIHILTHLAPEIFRVGPLTCYAQWVMETLIGNLGLEIGSLVDPYTNISNCGVLRAQLVAMYSLLPEIVPVPEKLLRTLPMHALDLGDSYAFLPRRDSIECEITTSEAKALKTYWIKKKWPNAGGFHNCLRRHGKLLLPNDQKVRSVWNESLSDRANRRRATIAKFLDDEGTTQYGEVQYFFALRFGDECYPLAMVSIFSNPDQDLLEKSYGTVHMCYYQGQDALQVIGVKKIKALVAMVPDFQISGDKVIAEDNKFFLVKKPSLQGQEFFGLDDLGEQDDDDNDDMVMNEL